MAELRRNSILFFLMAIGLMVLFVVNISLGSIKIPFTEVLKPLTGGFASRPTWDYIIVNYRLPKALVALFAGIALSVSGLLMQTLFRNPLAGPDAVSYTHLTLPTKA